MHVFGQGKPRKKIQPNTPEWKNARQECSRRASEVGEEVGLGDFEMLGAVAKIKYKNLPEYKDDPPFEGNEATRQGHLNEPKIRFVHQQYLRMVTGDDTIVLSDDTIWTVPVEGFDKPWGATPDGYASHLPVSSPQADLGTLGCEYKAPFNLHYRHWRHKYPGWKYNDMKICHYAQVQFQLGITGRKVADYVAICFKDREACALRVWFDEKFFSWLHDSLLIVEALEKLSEPEIRALRPETCGLTKPPLDDARVVALEEIYGKSFQEFFESLNISGN